MGETAWIDLGTEAVIAQFWSRANVVVVVGVVAATSLLSVVAWFFPAGEPTLSARLLGPIVFIPFGALFVFLYVWLERNSVIASRIGVSDQALVLESRTKERTSYSWKEPGFQVTVWDGAFDDSGRRRTADLGSHRVMIRIAASGRIREFYSSWAAVAAILRRASDLGIPISKDKNIPGNEFASPTIELTIGFGVGQANRRDPEEVRRLVLLS